MNITKREKLSPPEEILTNAFTRNKRRIFELEIDLRATPQPIPPSAPSGPTGRRAVFSHARNSLPPSPLVTNPDSTIKCQLL